MIKLCLIYNYAQHYREAIFTLIDKAFDCDFVFGDKYLDIKKMDYAKLQKVTEVQNVWWRKHMIYQRGVVKYAFKPYDAFIIIGEPSSFSTWLLLMICRLRGRQTYLWSHGWYGREGRLKKIIKKLFYGLANGVLLYGNYAKNLMLKEGYPERKLIVIYNSLSYEKQLEVRSMISSNPIFQEHFKNQNNNLIFIGRLSKVKRLDLILDAVSISDKSYNITFIGDGEEYQTLYDKAKSLELLENVWFYGACYDERELANLIFNADLCVAPGNVGLTAMHSLVYGCPVVTHNDFAYQMPEFEAIVPGRTGAFFVNGDVESLCQTIDNWFEQAPAREQIRQWAYEEMETRWNPMVQINIIENTIKRNL